MTENPDCEVNHNLPESFCIIPWMHLNVNPLGDVLQCCISSIKEILAGIPHVIIYPLNIYRESPDIVKPLFDWDHTQVVSNSISQAGEHIAHPDIVESVQQYFNDNLFAYTFHHAMIDVHARNEPCRCLLGHPNRASHEQMVDAYLMPWLRTQGII